MLKTYVARSGESYLHFESEHGNFLETWTLTAHRILQQDRQDLLPQLPPCDLPFSVVRKLGLNGTKIVSDLDLCCFGYPALVNSYWKGLPLSDLNVYRQALSEAKETPEIHQLAASLNLATPCLVDRQAEFPIQFVHETFNQFYVRLMSEQGFACYSELVGTDYVLVMGYGYDKNNPFCAALVVPRASDTGSYWEILSLCTSPTVRNMGVAHILVEYLADQFPRCAAYVGSDECAEYITRCYVRNGFSKRFSAPYVRQEAPAWGETMHFYSTFKI